MDKVKDLMAKFSKDYRGSMEDLERAVRLLADKPDVEAALKKVLPALEKEVVNVFFSYKKKDEHAAKKIISLLEDNSNKRLEFTSMAEFTRMFTGKAWRERLRELTRSAQWFILLFPDCHDDWDWCIYETGLFEAHLTSADSLICLHHPDSPIPKPMEDYQAVPATISSVEDFLHWAYLKDNPVPGMKPIHKSIKRNKISKIAKEIVEAIHPPKSEMAQEFFGPWIQLKIERATESEGQRDFDSATVVFCNPEALTLFRFFKQPKTWGQLRSNIKEVDGDRRWRDQLFDSIEMIRAKETPTPIQTVFKAPSGKMYRPAACAINYLKDAEGTIEAFHIAFHEEVGALDFSTMPKNLSTLVTVLRFGLRFRWEVLEQFGKSGITETDVECLESTLARMRTDWQSRGVGDQPAVESLFAQQKRERISQIFKAYHAMRNEQGTGELDKAIRDKDVMAIPTILAKILPMSQEFLEITTERFSELVSSGG